MATEQERYLAKARESLASARADVRAKRYNSAANRAYYAAFQAAVAALIHWNVRATDTQWEHRFVPTEFSDKLIRRRKLFSRELRGVLAQLFKTRITADYEADEVSFSRAERCVRRAATMVDAIDERMTRQTVSETRPVYEGTLKSRTTREPLAYVEDVKSRILSEYPEVDFRLRVRGARDFTLDVYGEYPDMWEVTDVEDLTMDILEDHDVWIVVLPHSRRDN